MTEILFSASLVPYLVFLWFITRSGALPRLALAGFYGTLLFVAISIPAAIYAQNHYHTNLANVDWLHGGAEFFLSLSNIILVLGLYKKLNVTASDN